MRIKITLSYNGSRFQGSQIQTRTPDTVMGVFAKALQRLGIESIPVASGRTDAGVHAFRQVVHIDLPPFWTSLTKLQFMLHKQLPPYIRIRHIEPAADDFHARFSAKRRVYRYILSDREPNPFEADLVTFSSTPLDLGLINRAMRLFEGTHDFEFFMKTGSEVHHCVRTIYKAFAYRHKGYVILYFEANAFLRSQIRMMAGSVLKVNRGRMSLEQLKEQVERKTRHNTHLAPAAGLYLSKIIY
jgi:tRNA pseudouridine38-40 synthase